MRPHLNFKQCTAKLIRSALFQPKTSASSAQSNASIKHCDVSVSLESAGARGWTMHTVIECPYKWNGARERKSSWNGGSSWIKILYYNIFIQELPPPRPTQFFGVGTQCGMHEHRALRHWMHHIFVVVWMRRTNIASFYALFFVCPISPREMFN